MSSKCWGAITVLPYARQAPAPARSAPHTLEQLEADESEARALLTRAARQAEPLMTKRRWFVPTLAEFSPRSPNLMGINENGGQAIRIRLRPAHDQRRLYHYEHVLGTLLHELAHIARGPHDAVFYKQLDELKAEVSALEARGVTGAHAAPFDGAGVRLGGQRPLATSDRERSDMRKRWLERERLLNLVASAVVAHRQALTRLECSPAKQAAKAGRRQRVSANLVAASEWRVLSTRRTVADRFARRRRPTRQYEERATRSGVCRPQQLAKIQTQQQQ